MPLDVTRARQRLKGFDLKALFVEELGWEHHAVTHHVTVDGRSHQLSAVAHKRGFAVFICAPGTDGRIPDYATRRKIDRQVAKLVHEHLVIFVDADKTAQIWQWLKKETGKPVACREHPFHRNQPGDALIQKLQALGVSIDEEAGLTLTEVTGRVRAAFDVERVTKRFYDRFKTEHAAFLQFLKGIPQDDMQRWYVSVMLNRLMFIYFIQKKGFLDSNPNYLRDKLAESKKLGKDRFYRDFLCPLFFEGFAKKESERSAATNKVLGRVPYLNGGLFLRHQIEELYGGEIQIADAAFEKLFAFFEQYTWHLDERPLKKDDEINPDVLGYIFEKYVNQKQMGAYYSKEDITGYISQNTVIPFLFDQARKECRIAFEGGHSIWRLLQDDPDRYIYDAVKKGVQPKLPPQIAAGLNDVSKRTEWNKAAPEEYALPTEIWREVVARRKRYEEVRGKLAGGEVRSINDLITYNLDIRQFAQDVVESSEGPELLRAFYKTITNVSVLDPACGSGAFLFAALNILESLYEACLDRMEISCDELDRSGQKHRPGKFADFKRELTRVADHPNRKYFIYKTIIVNNIFGVDIMEEATEICKLRLFLKLVAQIDRLDQIEPLPDIDFNIRAGNTLVGYASYDDVKRAVSSKLDFEGAMEKIEEKAQEVERLFGLFRQQQTEIGGEIKPEDKAELTRRLKALESELNEYLAGEYGVKRGDKNAYRLWVESYKPFHWFVEFYGIMRQGGFDAIIGNPPYLETREVDYLPRNFRCADSGAIHAMFMEQSIRLLDASGSAGMIVPLSLVSTQRMQIVQELLEGGRNAWYANFSWRPAKMFDTVNRALTIFTVTPGKNGCTFSTNYRKWTSGTRDLLMQYIAYVEVPRQRPACWIPKLGEPMERTTLETCLKVKTTLGRFTSNSQNRVYYRTTGGLYWKVFTDFAPAFKVNGKAGHSTRETWFTLSEAKSVQPVIAALSSGIFWWWYTVTSNCRDLNPYDVQNFPLPESVITDSKLAQLGKKYLDDLSANSTMLVRMQKQTGRTETQCFRIHKSKPIIDEIDWVLARHYGLTAQELDFILNYDIKYRMGDELEAAEE